MNEKKDKGKKSKKASQINGRIYLNIGKPVTESFDVENLWI